MELHVLILTYSDSLSLISIYLLYPTVPACCILHFSQANSSESMSAQGGNDFVTANFPESRELAPMAPGWQSSGQDAEVVQFP